MAFPTDDMFLGPQSFGVRDDLGGGINCAGIIWHTTEGGGVSREDALATARYQLTHAGSYNFIIYDGGLLLTVPYMEASGGTNPFSTSWAPQRYPFLKEQLPPAAYANPNEFQMNVAFSGRTAVFRDGGLPQNMVDTAARLTIWAQEQPWGADRLVHSGHMHWQTNRSDPSEVVLARIKAKVEELSDDNPFIDIDDSPHKSNIIAAAKAGVFAVPSSKLFSPKGLVTREQMATIAMRLLRAQEE